MIRAPEKERVEAGPSFRLKSRRKPTTNMPDRGRQAPDRLLSSLCHVATVGGGSSFSIPLPSPATQKGNVLQMSGKRSRPHGRASGFMQEDGFPLCMQREVGTSLGTCWEVSVDEG